MKATPRFSFARTTLARRLYGFALTGLLVLSAAHASDTPIAQVRETFQATRLGGDATQLEALPPWLRTAKSAQKNAPCSTPITRPAKLCKPVNGGIR